MSIRRTEITPDDEKWMARAVELAEKCETEPGRPTASPKVGAVAIGADGKLLAEAFRGQYRPGDHAEFAIVDALGEGSGLLAGATVFTTLEPCTTRGAPKIPCADRLVAEGVAIVWIGMLDPDARIRERGYSMLRESGVEVRDFSTSYRERIEAANTEFVERFQKANGPRGTVSFDYLQNAGKFDVHVSGSIVVPTKWSSAGHGSIHAYSSPGSIAATRTATKFADIDDPGLYEFAGHSKHVHEGHLVIFRHPDGFLLVRVDGVLAGPERGDPYTELKITYEFRGASVED